MVRKLAITALLVALVGGFVFAQNTSLTIDYQLNTAREDAANNYFTFTGPLRYIALERDQFDATSGASRLGSTAIFQPYRLDVLGRTAFPSGLRGLFLFAVANDATRVGDNLSVTRASTGVITINYVHRGMAYQIVTDRNGNIVFGPGTFRMRTIGFIQGAGPQVLHTDFSPDGTAARINWAAVWNANTRSGQTIGSTQTGRIVDDGPAANSMFYYNGNLQTTFTNNILKIAGSLTIRDR